MLIIDLKRYIRIHEDHNAVKVNNHGVMIY